MAHRHDRPGRSKLRRKPFRSRFHSSRRFKCYESGAPSEAPLAWFTRLRRKVVDGVLTTTPTYFVFAEGVAEVPDLMDTFLAFWLLIIDRANQRLQRLGVAEGRAYATAASAGFPGGGLGGGGFSGGADGE
jgi:hypothetical protein